MDCLHPQVKACTPEIRTSAIDWAQLNRLLPEDGDSVSSPKRRLLNRKQDDG